MFSIVKIKTADREFPCDSRLIEEFLEGSLSNPQIDYLTRHLDNCEACGRELENLAADSANWSEAKSLLAKSRTDLPEIESAVRTSEPLPLPARQVLDFLNPTDDPASL
jgi:predicted anti-sigma-YlaC factor YlaD